MNAEAPVKIRIESDEEYMRLLAEIETLMGTPVARRIDALADLLTEYEQRRWPMGREDEL